MRQFAEGEALSGVVREALGAAARVVGVERLLGGSKKGVYRVRTDGPRPAPVIVYSWAEAEDFWPGADGVDAADPFAPASGLVPFLAARRTLDGLGVRVPTVLLADDSRTGLVLERALRDLDEAARRDPRIGSAAALLRDRLREMAARVAPRTEHGLVHGELGPDHVLVDRAGQPVLIDIEGLMYFDVEWEHVFLRLRFGERYPDLARPGLDPARLDLYTLATHLSLVAGPLRLLDGDFPHRDVMRGIAEHNAAAALALLPR